MIGTFRKIVFAALSAFVMVACTDNDPFSSYSEDSVNVSFTATLDNGNHGARSGESQPTIDVTHMKYQVFTSTMQEGSITEVFEPTAVSGEVAIDGGQVNINVDFVKNQCYRIVFLAYNKQKSEAGNYPYAIADDLTSMSVDYSKYTAGHDLFYAVSAQLVVNASGTISEANRTVTLVRPFATIALCTEDATEEYVSEAVEVTFTDDLFTKLDLTTGYPVAEGAVKTLSAVVNKETTSSMSVNNKPVYKFASFNVLTHPNGSQNTMSFTLAADDVQKTDIPVTFSRNYLVKVAGDIVEVRAWDGVTFTAPKTTPDKCSATGYALHVESPDQLAYLLKYGTTATSIHICSDMDMGGHALNTVANLPDGATISGLATDGETKHVIYNLQLNDVQGLFGDVANNLKINNLEIGGVTLNSNSANNVGVLLGKATGSLEMTNVTVDGCTVSGSRNVGGMVGYVEGNATFAGCVSKNVTTTATGDPATVSTSVDYKTTGAMVGVFKGNAEGETLTFDADCSVESYTTGAGAYVATNQSCWVEGTLDAKYDNALGNEEFCRGTVTYGTVRIVPHWDGIRKVAPIGTADNGTVSTCEIWSPFDLAYLQGKSLTSVTFKSDVDMDGKGNDGIANIPSNFPSAQVSGDDKIFTPISSIATLDGQNKTLYNLSVSMVGGNAAFVSIASGGMHKDFIIDNACIINVHDPDIPYPRYYGDLEDKGQGNAYAGTLLCGVSGNYNANKIQVKNSAVYAVCKMGGLIGRATSSNDLKIENCSVDNCYLENYNPFIPNFYSFGKEPYGPIASSYYVDLLQWWYTCGEVGGLIGFVKCNKATIDKCSVTNTDLNCVGQEDKDVWANVYKGKPNPRFKNDAKIQARATTIIAGRHVNQFIGEVVSERAESASSGYDVTIKDYYVSNNTYLSGKNHHNYDTSNECEVVGSAYYVGVYVNLTIVKKHVQYTAGSLTFNPNGGTAITITELPEDGKEKKWTGGNFENMKVNLIVQTYKSIYPEDPGFDYWGDGKGSR